MPIRTQKKTKRKKVSTQKKENQNVGDVTINHFANATSGLHGRLKKSSTNVTCEVKNSLEKEETWEDLVNDELEENSKADGNKKILIKKGDDSLQDESTGFIYPLDLWFLISEYITPECVGKFASICKSSYHVVQTAKFWYHLYKRYYRYVPDVPERLKPACMVWRYELRACVIRSLYHTYFTSGKDIECLSRSSSGPHSLVKRLCCLNWYTSNQNRWFFYFKLKDVAKVKKLFKLPLTNNKDRGQQEFYDMLQDVSANSDENCKVLRVTCMNYSMIPPVDGLFLQKVVVSLAAGFKHHRMQLYFSTSQVSITPSQIVMLNGVVDFQVLDWWHPRYPHKATITVISPAKDHWDIS